MHLALSDHDSAARTAARLSTLLAALGRDDEKDQLAKLLDDAPASPTASPQPGEL
jgi:hypothetical protein